VCSPKCSALFDHYNTSVQLERKLQKNTYSAVPATKAPPIVLDAPEDDLKNFYFWFLLGCIRIIVSPSRICDIFYLHWTCACAHKCICIYVCVYVSFFVYLVLYLYVYISTCTWCYIYIRLYIHCAIYIYMYIYIYVYGAVFIYIYIHIYMYMVLYIYIYLYICIVLGSLLGQSDCSRSGWDIVCLLEILFVRRIMTQFVGHDT